MSYKQKNVIRTIAEPVHAIPVYVLVIWSKGMPEADRITLAIRERFTILKQFDVHWPKRHFIANLTAFYGWKSFTMWAGKMNRSGAGDFRVIVVRDEKPAFVSVDGETNPELLRDQNVFAFKMDFRQRTARSNVLHAAVNEAETRQNLQALLGVSTEEFLRRNDLDGTIGTLSFDRPIHYVEYPYAEENGKGPRFFQGKFKFNRVVLYFLPNCGVPTIFSFSFRIFGLFSLSFCIGKVKVG